MKKLKVDSPTIRSYFARKNHKVSESASFHKNSLVIGPFVHITSTGKVLKQILTLIIYDLNLYIISLYWPPKGPLHSILEHALATKYIKYCSFLTVERV